MKMKFVFFSRFSMKLAIFLRNFDEILPEFHRNVQEMRTYFEILRKRARKIRKMLEISGICEKSYFSFHFFICLPSSRPSGQRMPRLARCFSSAADEKTRRATCWPVLW
jgi:hypothetical protein